MTEARNVDTTMGHFIGLGSIAEWPVHTPGMIGLGFSSPMMPHPARPSASEVARVTAVANQDDDGLDEFGQLEKRAAALAVRWYHHEDKQERILNELEEINEQIDYPHFAILNPAKWVSDQELSTIELLISKPRRITESHIHYFIAGKDSSNFFFAHLTPGLANQKVPVPSMARRQQRIIKGTPFIEGPTKPP